MSATEYLWHLGDVNRDGTIDQADGDIIGEAFDTVPGDPKWNVDADLNQDGVVDILDLSTWGLHVGMSLKPTGFELWFPPLVVPGITIPRGFFLNENLFGAQVTVPWSDVKLWDEIKITDGFKLFDFSEIVQTLLSPILWIPEAVFSFAKTALDKMAGEYYEEEAE